LLRRTTKRFKRIVFGFRFCASLFRHVTDYLKVKKLLILCNTHYEWCSCQYRP